MNIFFSMRFEISLKKHGFILRLDLNDWHLELSKSKSMAVKTLSVGPFHLTHINYDEMNKAVNEMIAEYDFNQPDIDQYFMAELDNNTNPNSLN